MYDNQVDEAKENINFLMESCRFTTYQDARRVRLVDGLGTNLEQIFYDYHLLNGKCLRFNLTD